MSPDIFDSIEDIEGQSPKDFGFGQQLKVKDEIALSWADAQDYWHIFQRKIENLGEKSRATTQTRNQWIVPLLELLGYEIEFRSRGEHIEGRYYQISHRISNRANTPLNIIGICDPAGLDKKSGSMSRRMSAHAIMQEFLNLREELFGIVTDGVRIRLLRNSSRLVKQSYLEFDLERIFTDGLFADFSVFYRILHASRLPKNIDQSAECFLEKYHQDSLDSGARIRERLSIAVKDALQTLGNGFLNHSRNVELRAHIESGRINSADYFQFLLRLIYRLLFLIVIEERDLVFPSNTSKEKRSIYDQYYSVSRIRQLSEKRSSFDPRKEDLWLALQACFHLFETDGPGLQLGISPLAGNLFSPKALGELVNCGIDNSVLLGCLNSLGVYYNPESRQRIRVNYAALNVEEFGSVYEGLLEFKPVFENLGNTFGSPRFTLKQGSERAATGSHYTPDELVQPLIRHSIDHLIEWCEREEKPESALLDLKVADIACGSGHILLAAARRIAISLAAIRTSEEQPSPEAYRAALRDVICNCIYGVDLNPLAVELCKVAFWLEAHSPGQPLNFLDHHIKCGNAIVGFSHRKEVDKGIPTEAFNNQPNDDRAIAARFRKKNEYDRSNPNQQTLRFKEELNEHLDSVIHDFQLVERLPENNSAEVETKKEMFEVLENSRKSDVLKTIANIPIAQFYIDKKSENEHNLIVDSQFRQFRDDKGQQPIGNGLNRAIEIGREKRFFHWYLEFPEVIEDGGFDCVVGNPPYLGGQHLSGTLGHSFCECMKWLYAPAGLSELVVFFLRRAFELLKPNGFLSVISTNSIVDGRIRKDGLDQIFEKGGEIIMAVRGENWSGVANLIVSLLTIYDGKWSGNRYLDNEEVTMINSFFEEGEKYNEPVVLSKNKNYMFQGYTFLGSGFLLTHDEAEELCLINPANKNVIMQLINGRELNTDPDQKPARSIINFRDWPVEKAQVYSEPFAIVEEKVRPFRMTQKLKKDRDYWWRFCGYRPKMTQNLRDLSNCFVSARTTKFLSFSRLPSNLIFSDATYVFTTDRWDLFSIVQSTIHEIWARKYSGSLATRLRYSPSNCFVNYPFPSNLFDSPDRELAEIGELYHTHRKEVMLSLNLGLTKIYNLFHSSDLTPELIMAATKTDQTEATIKLDSILRLRELRVELDTIVRDAYGWSDLNLEHGFHELEFLSESDRMRYTLSGAARKELLRRLLDENLTRTKA